jgi:hypothetical protein
MQATGTALRDVTLEINVLSAQVTALNCEGA